jgi:hypothetical protein
VLFSEGLVDNSITNERKTKIDYNRNKNHGKINKPEKFGDLKSNPKSLLCESCGKCFDNGQALTPKIP